MINNNDINNSKIHAAHNKYTDAYIDILNTYKEQLSSSVEEKNKLKEKFFNTIKFVMYILTWLFLSSIIISFILFAIMIFKGHQSAAVITGAITAIISSFTTMVISISKLPKIIAEYLFNKEEDKLMNKIIRNIQKYEINAVRHEIENAKIERMGHLSAEANITAKEDGDTDLLNSIYETPSQNSDYLNDNNSNTQAQEN